MSMCYVVQPSLWRECYRVFDFVGLKDGEQADISCSRTALEIQVGRVSSVEDGRKVVTKAVPGDVVKIQAEQSMKLKQRIVHVEVNDELYKCGRPSFKRMYETGETLFAPMTFECFEPVDFSKLDYLYKVYIVDGVVR